MSTLELLMSTAPSLTRPEWCSRRAVMTQDEVLSVLYEPARGEVGLRAVAQVLDEHAERLKITIGRVARVRKGEFEGVYAAPPVLLEPMLAIPPDGEPQ